MPNSFNLRVFLLFNVLYCRVRVFEFEVCITDKYSILFAPTTITSVRFYSIPSAIHPDQLS